MDVALEPLAAGCPADDELDVSVVIPCLNEVRTVGACVMAALDGIEAAGLRGEVIVADNGSTDGSVPAAKAAGALVVPALRRGYGAALQAGFAAARGRLLVMGDADLSYDFRELPKFVDEQRRTGADIVLGDRLGGRIEPGAMPWTHRWIGNPLISLTMRRLFQVPLNDCYCGLRLLTRDSYRRLRLNTNSMEFALEMIVQGALVGMRFSQVPITLHVDGRDRAPHLRTVSDGYRSFRLLFQHAPITVYGLVGGLAIALGFALDGRAAWQEVHGGAVATGAADLGAALVLSGWVLSVLGVIARVFATGFLGGRSDHPLQRLFRVATLETAVLASAVMFVLGLTLVLGPVRSEALVQLGLTLCVMAFGTFVGAFVVSLVGRAIPNEVTVAAPAGVMAAAPQPVAAALPVVARRGVGVPAPNYDRWLVDSLRGAWEGSRSVLDFGSAASLAEAVASTMTGTETTLVRIDAEVALRLTENASEIAAPDIDSVTAYDAVVSAALLEHIDDDVGALRAMTARLTPGGRIGLLVAGGGDRLFGPLDKLNGHFRRYTEPRLRARLRTAGLNVESMRRLDAAGAIMWRMAARRAGSDAALTGWSRPPDRLVPILRRIDGGFGQWLVAIARRTL